MNTLESSAEPSRESSLERPLRQPGEPLEPRRVVLSSAPGREFRVQLGAGQDLLTDLTAALIAKGLRHAAVTLLRGCFSELHFLVGKADDSGQRVATYGDPLALEGPVRLLGGHALLGEDADGAPLLHCHALFLDREGEPCGGHLIANSCRAGKDGLTVLVTELCDAGFKVAYESETNYAIFQPSRLTGQAKNSDNPA
tara:strand:- start:1480 stop:2073 length:594 start_codon:yes stop_codon:yes gene_type:complete